MVRSLVDTLSEREPGVLEWFPVVGPAHQLPWVGVHLDDLSERMWRKWAFDVVHPADRVHGDALTVSVIQDVCLVRLYERVPPRRHVTMTVPVSAPPTQLSVPAHAMCPNPWCVELQTGWSAGRIARAVEDWIVLTIGRSDLHVARAEGGLSEPYANTELPQESGAQSPGGTLVRGDYTLVDGMTITDEAMDTMLSVDPAVSAALMTTLTAVYDALEPWRE